jgi:hypothetical protein
MKIAKHVELTDIERKRPLGTLRCLTKRNDFELNLSLRKNRLIRFRPCGSTRQFPLGTLSSKVQQHIRREQPDRRVDQLLW